MAGEVDVAAANGILKRVYDPKLGDVRPKSSILQRRHKFDSANKVGESYQYGVLVQPPNGFTYLGSSGAVKPLNTPRNSVIRQASITPFELDLREQVSWAAMSRAAEAGDQAIKQLTGELVIGMKNAMANRLEAGLLHGQRGYGTVESVTDAGGGVADVVISAATWAPGVFWAFGNESTWDAFTGTSKNNTGTLGILKGINSATRTIKITFSGTLASEIAAGDVLFPAGANAGSGNFDELPGYLIQASNTTGLSLGINAGTFPNWAGNLVDVAGANPSHGVVEELLSILRDRGAEGSLTVYVSNKMFSVLAVELAQLRMIDGNQVDKGKQGFRMLAYFSPDIGEVEIVNHPMMKQGELLILPDDECKRVGSSDITFGIPGMPSGEDLVFYVPGFNAAELGTWMDQAAILRKPSWSLVATGFLYT